MQEEQLRLSMRKKRERKQKKTQKPKRELPLVQNSSKRQMSVTTQDMLKMAPPPLISQSKSVQAAPKIQPIQKPILPTVDDSFVQKQKSSPQRQKVQARPERDILEQLSEYQILDKVIPSPNFAKEIYACFERNDQLLLGLVGSISATTATLISQKGHQLVVDLPKIKYLAKAYICQVGDLEPMRIPEELQKFIRSEGNLVLIQVISQQQHQNSDGASIHRLHAVISVNDNISLYPVVFQSKAPKRKQQLQESDSDFCYLSEQVKFDTLSQARQIQSAWEKNYLARASKIEITSDNCQDCLYLLCHIFQRAEESKPVRIGILTKIKPPNQLFFCFFQHGQRERVGWINMQDFQCFADLTLGHVSADYLYDHDIFEAKIRNIKFISQRESLQARNKQPRPPLADSLCKICKYHLLDTVRTLTCVHCNSSFHEMCLSQNQIKNGEETNWHCQDCLRCKNCKLHSSSLLVCTKCNSAQHFECISPDYKQQIRDLNQTEEGLIAHNFKCEKCVSCESCGQTGSPGEGALDKWSRDFKLCSSCNKKRDLKMYCSTCEQFWLPDDEMLRCGSCQMWVHTGCDRMLQATLHKFTESPDYVYECVPCRWKQRANFIEQLLDFMINEDKRKEFFYPFWEAPNNQAYLTIIKNPLCFLMIKNDLQAYQNGQPWASLKYLSQPESFKRDIDRIFTNAKAYNSLQSEIHKLAVRMHEKCNQFFSAGRVEEILQINSKICADELAFKNQIMAKRVEEHQFLQKPKELFQMHEQLDVRHYPHLLKEGGRRTRANEGNQYKRRKLESGQERELSADWELKLPLAPSLEVEPLVSPQEHRSMLQEANRRLLLQNLSNLLQNLQKGADKDVFQLKTHTSGDVLLSPKSRWKQLVEDLRQSDDKDKCWYQSPVRISFDDPSLIFEEMCYLCGSFGNQEDFLCCNLCGESFHPYCLPCPKDSISKFQKHWLCYNCIFCEKCHSSKQWEDLLICDVCEKVDHFWCLEPQLIQVPECSWKCPDCFQCRACGTKKFFSERDIANKVNLDPNEKYVLSYDFEFCYQCGQDQFRKSFCNICHEKTGLGLIPNQSQQQKKSQYSNVLLDNQDDLNKADLQICVKCNYYSHLKCSRTSQATIRKLEEAGDYQGFQCLDCLLADKQPGFYLHEQCELYADLHNRTNGVLATACQMILAKYTSQQALTATFIQQSWEFLSSNHLIQKWISFLKADDLHSSTEEDIENSQTISCSDYRGDTTMCQDQHRFNAETPQKRDMYVSLYLKVNRLGTLPEIADFDVEQIMNVEDVDRAEILTSLETRCVTKIRMMFFEWLENVAGIAVNNMDLLCQKPELPEETPMICENPEQEQVEQELMCEEEDFTIQNPQQKLTCILCQQSGEKRITGRLIPFQVNQFVHVNCAFWTSEVQEGTEEQVVSSELYNFFFAFKEFRKNICGICGLKGATLICSNSCMKKEKCTAYHFPCAYASGKVSFGDQILCEACTKKDRNAIVGLPLKFKDYHKRRIVIVKNIQPQCTNAFKSASAMPVEPVNSSGASGPPNQLYSVFCNKWRPYYYDMFNRAGNLTILSLSSEANSLIEGLYNHKNQSNTWHERMKGNKIKNQEDPSEYASLRIYWNYEDGQTQPQKKGYFLFNRGEEFSQIQKGDTRVLQHANKRTRQHLNVNLTQYPIERFNVQNFWSQQIENIRRRYSQFTQESTYLTPQIICGLDKYPIQYWNNPQEKMGLPLKDLQVATFFYKQAEKVIEKQGLFIQREDIQPSTEQQPQPASGLHLIFQNILKANKHVDKDGFTVQEANGEAPQAFTESQVKQMLHQLNKSEANVFNSMSTRHMSYDQVMGCLGKKTRNQLQKLRLAQQSNKNILEDDPSLDPVSPIRKKLNVGNDQLEQLDVSKQQSNDTTAKGNDINANMKYRAAKQNPKAVEVWRSKIHRNGLFAMQQFNPKDIVIEYVGEKIRHPVGDKREKTNDDCYMFALDNEYIIDATYYGNKARYINHSCDPNLKSDKLVINGETHIVFYALRHIEKAEELCFDYQFDYEENKIECFCMAKNCKGRLN